MKNLYEERRRKADKIIELYRTRRFRQIDIAKEFKIPVEVVAKVTKAYGFEHGKEKSADEPCNLNDGQTIEPIICYGDMGYLDEYDFE